MNVKLIQVSTFLCTLLLLLCIGGNKAFAQQGPVTISGPTTVPGGNTSVYTLSPTVGNNVYVVWTAVHGQIISAPPNSSLEGFGINTCYVTWDQNITTGQLTVTLPRNTPIQQYSITVRRSTGLANEAENIAKFLPEEQPAVVPFRQ
ncbi:hypothetical protein ACDQ55_10735 [Chitinophaga sp. 30R24]|uniref:hypothetical protein n=1 Tax=Chitinophaga sp. 30R24 TaxID=3248838 RepID=UPI003B901FDB